MAEKELQMLRFMARLRTPWGVGRAVAAGAGDAAGEVLVAHSRKGLTPEGLAAAREVYGAVGRCFNRFWPVDDVEVLEA